MEAETMTNDRAKRIHQICSIAASISLLTAGILLMIACYGIYSSGDHPFSREAVAEAFAPISLPIYLCAALIVLGILADLLLPRADQARKPEKQLALILQRLHARTDLSKCGNELPSQIAAQQRSRRLHRTNRNALTILASAIFLSFALNIDNFHQTQINESMLRAMYLLAPCLCIPFGYGIFTAFHARSSMQKEIDLLKSAPREAQRPPVTQAAVPVNENRTKALRLVLLVAGIAILVYGFFMGGTADVLTKAINICTECVGLG